MLRKLSLLLPCVGATVALGVTWPASRKPAPPAAKPKLVAAPKGGCECTESSDQERGQERGRQRTDGAKTPAFETKGFRTWFQSTLKGRVPSPTGALLTESDFAAGSYSATFGGEGGSAEAGVDRTQKFLRLSFGDRARGGVVLSLSKATIEPKRDGTVRSLYGEAKLFSERNAELRVQLVVLRGSQTVRVGAPQSMTVRGGAWQTVQISAEMPRAGGGGKDETFPVDCGSQPYSVGISIEPSRSEKGEVRVDDAAVGYVADPCCAEKEGQGKPGRDRPRPGRGKEDDKGEKEGCCDDASVEATAQVGKDGAITWNITPPAGADSDFEPTAEIVDYDAGDVNDLFPGVDTSSTGWMDQYPCKKAIGGLSTSQIQNLVFGDPELGDEGFDKGEGDQVGEFLSKVEAGLEEQGKEDTAKEDAELDEEDKDERVWMPEPATGAPWAYERNSSNPNQWAFYPGADIVYVHGLKLNHLKDLMGVPGNQEHWLDAAGLSKVKDRNEAVQVEWKKPQNVNGPAAGDNLAYYSGYFKKGAEWYWEDGENGVNLGHIPLFLRGSGDPFVMAKTANGGYVNRHLIVAYSCADKLKNGAKAMLREIADAMRFGTGVVNPKNPKDIGGFGSRGLVIVSHSTGGLVTNVAMQLGKRRKKWHAGWVVDHVKLHVAADSAMSGSRIATAAIAAAVAADFGIDYGLAYIGAPPVATRKALAKLLDLCGLPIPADNFTKPLRKSILLDLVPGVAQNRWGRFFFNIAAGGKKSFEAKDPDDYVPPTLLVPGAHPTQTSPWKYGYLLQGLDDGVVNMNSASGNPNPAMRWPSGFLGDPVYNYDLGIYLDSVSMKVKIGFLTIGITGTGLNQKKRANRYYLDAKDANLVPAAMNSNPDKSYILGPFFFAAGPDYHLSPTGMMQSYASGADLYRHHVLQRYPNMFVAVSAASDHYDGTIGSTGGLHWNEYQDTKKDSVYEKNLEETFVVGPNDGPVYHAFTPPAFRSGSLASVLGRPVLNGPLSQHMVTRGLRVWFKLFGKMKSFWVVKRNYILLEGWQSREKFDYVYWNVLGGGR